MLAAEAAGKVADLESTLDPVALLAPVVCRRHLD